MFEDFGDESIVKPKSKTVHFILNGHPQETFSHTFSKSFKREDLEFICDVHWTIGKLKMIRFFSLEGVEYIGEEVSYIRNATRIYVSKGQQFDSQRNFGQYKLLNELGEGGFGKVWLAQSSITQEYAAIKLIKLQKIVGARDIDMAFRQVQNLRSLNHPNIIKILNCYTLSNMQLVVVMEYLSGGQLISLLKLKGSFSQTESRTIFSQIISAISYCHEQNIIHRDLKLQNVLVANKKELKIKIADFGISGVADSFNEEINIGTLRYMAPEVLSRKEKINTSGVDVWACGVMLYAMVYGKLPFTGISNSDIISKIVSGQFQFPSKPYVSKECKDLIKNMLNIQPSERANINQLAQHDWMTCDLQNLPKVQQTLFIPRPKMSSKDKIRMIQLKKIAVIPKRLQKQKEKLIEQLRKFECNKKKINYSQAKKLHVGSQDILTPSYMMPVRSKEQGMQRRKQKRSSLLHKLWK